MKYYEKYYTTKEIAPAAFLSLFSANYNLGNQNLKEEPKYHVKPKSTQ